MNDRDKIVFKNNKWFYKIMLFFDWVGSQTWIMAEKWLDFAKFYFDFIKNLSVVVLLQILAEKSQLQSLYYSAMISYFILITYIFLVIMRFFRFEKYAKGIQSPYKLAAAGIITLILVTLSLKISIVAINEVMFALIGAQRK
jgi:hypothetical protein